MPTTRNNSINMKVTENADGFDVAGGTTERTLTVSGGDIILTASGANSYTYPAASDTLVGRTSTDTMTNKTLTSPILNTGVSGTAVLDEDAMGTDSATQLATQQSIKAYVDANTIFIKAITVESPTSSEDLTMFFTDDAITITQMNAVLLGSSTPSVTWKIRHHSDRSNAGNAVVTAGTTTTSTTTGSEVTSFDDATIPAGSWVWFETTAQSGTVDEINVSLEFIRD